ncbi:MAG: hypothetical protein IJW62_07200 [Clostridia bacterium]|nr:hypothetical protein [Clostridia bacterium]
MKPMEWLVIGGVVALIAVALAVRLLRRAKLRRATLPLTLAYLEAGGMQSPRYSPKESIAGMVYPYKADWEDFQKSVWHTVRKDFADGKQYVSGIYRDYPVLLSQVHLWVRDEDPNAPLIALGSGSYNRQWKDFTYFRGEWFIFRMKARCDADLTLIDRRLTQREDDHYPGGTTKTPRCVPEPILVGLYDAYGSSAQEEAICALMTSEAVRVLKKLHERYRPVIFLRGNQLQIGLSELDLDFLRHSDETEEEWQKRQNLFAVLDDLTELIRLWGDPPKE